MALHEHQAGSVRCSQYLTQSLLTASRLLMTCPALNFVIGITQLMNTYQYAKFTEHLF